MRSSGSAGGPGRAAEGMGAAGAGLGGLRAAELRVDTDTGQKHGARLFSLTCAFVFPQGALGALLLQLVRQISWLRSLPDARREPRSCWLSALPAPQAG